MKDTLQPRRSVLITDYKNSPIAAEVPFLFKKAGCRVEVLCTKRSWLLKNCQWDTHISSEGASPEEYAALLEKTAKAKKYDWVILCDDLALDVVNQHISDDAIALTLLPITKAEGRTMISSKAGLHVLAKKYGIQSPKGEVYSEGRNIAELAERVGFPLLLKVDKSGGGEGVFFCKNIREVRDQFALLTGTQKKDLLLQEYISGDIVSAESLFGDGKLLAYISAVIHKNIAGEFSVSYEREYCARPDIEQSVVETGEKLGMHGFSSMTFMREATTGKYYLVEADMRPQVWFPFGRFFGVDFSTAIANYFEGNGQVLRAVFPRQGGSLVTRNFVRTMVHSIGVFDVAEIVKWICNRDGRWMGVPWYDLRLLRADLVDITKFYGNYVYTAKYFSPVRTAYRKIKYGLWGRIETI